MEWIKERTLERKKKRIIELNDLSKSKGNQARLEPRTTDIYDKWQLQ
jgi:hypothetical protein